MDEDALLQLTAARRCWLKLLEPIDAPGQVSWETGRVPTRLRFDSRPNDVRTGHLVFCVDPDRVVIFAVAEVLEDGVTALHDFEASNTVRWLFKVPVRVFAVVADRTRAPHLRVAGGAAARFSYRALTRPQVERVAVALAAAL